MVSLTITSFVACSLRPFFFSFSARMLFVPFVCQRFGVHICSHTGNKINYEKIVENLHITFICSGDSIQQTATVQFKCSLHHSFLLYFSAFF